MHTTAHAHHERPRGGGELTSLAILATLHCLTGCAIGEIAGMVIGTSLGGGQATRRARDVIAWTPTRCQPGVLNGD